MSRKNEKVVDVMGTEVSVVDTMVATTYTDSDILKSAIRNRAGDTHIEENTDSDGNTYLKATYELKAPVNGRTEIYTVDMDLATRIERVNNALALGDVSYFVVAKEMENFTETEATELGFDDVTKMCMSIFGLGKSTIENYRKLSRFFITSDYRLNGAIPQDTPISMLNQLISYVKVNDDGTHDISNVETLFTSGIITPYMKQSEYKARLSKLKSLTTDRELSELTTEELQELKECIVADSIARKESKQGKKQESEKQESDKQETSGNVVEVSDNPQVVIGEILSMIAKIDRYAIDTFKLEPASAIRQALDTLNVEFTELLETIEE